MERVAAHLERKNMREKIKKHIKKIVPLIAVLTMVVGVLNVPMISNASEYKNATLITVGSKVEFDYIDGSGNHISRWFTIDSIDSTSPIYLVPMYSSALLGGRDYIYMTLFSESEFTIDYTTYGFRLEDSQTWGPQSSSYCRFSDLTVGDTSFKYTETVFYGSCSDVISMSVPYLIASDFYVKDILTKYLSGSEEEEWIGDMSFTFDGDLTEALSNSNIGWLKELKRTLLQYSGTGGDSLMESTKFKTRYSWLVENTDWDESYKVALYKKMVVEDKNLFKDNEIVEETDLVYIGSANYSDGKIEYYNEDIDYMQIFYNLASKYGLGYVSYYDDYLIIYHVTEEGIEYGYWNQLLHDDDGLPSQEYGVFDDNGNFIEGGSLGDIDTESGIGSSEEDAENSVVPDNNNGNLGDEIDLEGSIGDIFGQFFNSLKNVFSFIGKFPSMISEFFGFLPVEVVSCISLGLIMVIALRFLGR